MNASSPHIRPWLAGLAALLNLAALHHPTTLSASAQEPIRVSGEAGVHPRLRLSPGSDPPRPCDFEVVWTDRFPGQVLSSLVTASDDVVFMGSVGTPTAAGRKLHILRVSGHVSAILALDSKTSGLPGHDVR